MLRKKLFWIIVTALLLVTGGGSYFYYNSRIQAQDLSGTAATATYTVSRGDLVLTADGSGTLVPTSEVDTSFQSGGRLAEVLVKVGDKVKAGQLLARLNDTDAQNEISQAQISLREAQLELETLTEPASAADLAAAENSLASAKAELTALTSPASSQDVLAARETLKSAKESLATLLAGPDAEDVTSAKADLTVAELSLRAAQAAYDQVAWRPDIAMLSQSTDLWQATADYDKAKATYDNTLQSTSADEIASARAAVASAQSALNTLLEEPDADELSAAQAKVAQAQAELDDLQAGATAAELEAAQLAVDQAQLTVDSAQRALDQTQLLAPVTGTVTAVAANAGETVGTDAIVTLANLDEPVIEFWVEESDLESVVVGNAVNVTFEALPDYTFPGKVQSVDPALTTVDSTPAVQAYASVDLSAHPFTPLSGMNVTVEVVSGEARNALLVPVEALQTTGENQYSVSVVHTDGTLELRQVEVGLKDYVNAEILSGLEEGEVISAGSATNAGTTSSQDASPAAPSGGDQGMPMMGPPGMGG